MKHETNLMGFRWRKEKEDKYQENFSLMRIPAWLRTLLKENNTEYISTNTIEIFFIFYSNQGKI